MEVSPAVQPTLLSLPNEVLEEILFSPVLCVRDLCRTRQVCWHLHHIVQRLWTRVATRLACKTRDYGSFLELPFNYLFLLLSPSSPDGSIGGHSLAPPTRSGTVSVVRDAAVSSSYPLPLTSSADNVSR